MLFKPLPLMSKPGVALNMHLRFSSSKSSLSSLKEKQRRKEEALYLFWTHFYAAVLLFFVLWVLCSHVTVAACDGYVRSLSPPTLFQPHAAEQIPPEPGMAQHAPGHETLAPAPQPEIPRLEPPLIGDRERYMELYHRFNLYYIGRHEIRDLAAFAGRLERAVPIERHVEAALVGDGYAPDQIRLRISQIREILFAHPTRMLLLSERTLARYLNELETNGTRQSIPYRRVVRAIRNHDISL